MPTTTKNRHPQLVKVVAALRDAIVILERFETRADRKDLAPRILQVLELGPASTGSIRALCRRTSKNVRDALALLSQAGRIRRNDDHLWELCNTEPEGTDGEN